MQVIIDGHNVMFAWEGVRQACLRNPQAGRRLVVEAASRYRAQRPGRKVTVVFDGRETSSNFSPKTTRESEVRVIYSKPPMNADLVIRELVEVMQGKEETWVVSSDREVQAHARACGAKVFGAKGFENEMLGRAHSRNPSPVSPREGKEKPTRVRGRDVEFWLRAMGEER